MLLVTPTASPARISATASILLGGAIGDITATVTVEINQLTRDASPTARSSRSPSTRSSSSVASRSTLALPAGPVPEGVGHRPRRSRSPASGSPPTSPFEQRARLDARRASSITPVVNDTTVRFANLSLRIGTPERDIVLVSNGSGEFADRRRHARRRGRHRRPHHRDRRGRHPRRRRLGHLRRRDQHAHHRPRCRRRDPRAGPRSSAATDIEHRGRRPAAHRQLHVPQGRDDEQITIELDDVSLALGNGTTTLRRRSRSRPARSSSRRRASPPASRRARAQPDAGRRLRARQRHRLRRDQQHRRRGREPRASD